MAPLTLPNGVGLENFGKFNVLIGKNGSGKSTLLRQLDVKLQEAGGCIRYITPERGGDLTYDGNIDTNRGNDPQWITNVRRRNRYEQFRQSSVAEYRNLETLVLRSIERDPALRSTDFTFDTEVDRINTVLDRVRIERTETSGFAIVVRATGQRTAANELSSGEAELISLAIEILYFAYLCKQVENVEKENWLLLDEPDVHLHPDLQHRLMEVLVSSIGAVNGRVLLATHSTALLSSLAGADPDVRVGFKHTSNLTISFRPVNEALRSVLPIFGAHPLSSVFNARPPLIVEGEDDERIWQTAIRSSEGRIKLYPCVAGNKNSLNAYEAATKEIIDSVYEGARAFSLRDRDDDSYEIDDLGSVVRLRLNCRSAENLILSDDVLEVLGVDWTQLEASLNNWLEANSGHVRHGDVESFRASGWDRQNFRVKSLRMLAVGLAGSDKPWEVAVGQAIARLPTTKHDGMYSLRTFLGPKAVSALRLA